MKFILSTLVGLLMIASPALAAEYAVGFPDRPTLNWCPEGYNQLVTVVDEDYVTEDGDQIFAGDVLHGCYSEGDPDAAMEAMKDRRAERWDRWQANAAARAAAERAAASQAPATDDQGDNPSTPVDPVPTEPECEEVTKTRTETYTETERRPIYITIFGERIQIGWKTVTVEKTREVPYTETVCTD